MSGPITFNEPDWCELTAQADAPVFASGPRDLLAKDGHFAGLDSPHQADELAFVSNYRMNRFRDLPSIAGKI